MSTPTQLTACRRSAAGVSGAFASSSSVFTRAGEARIPNRPFEAPLAASLRALWHDEGDGG